MKFYYFMYGKTIGSLAVKLTLSDGRTWYIFYKKGDQDQYWKRGIGNIDLTMGLRGKYIPEILRPGSDAELFMSRT